jgi:glyoxylase-like metal-dependent hydrolase (beta-lactamase superfamily II)
MDEDSRDAVVIDPGDEAPRIVSAIEKEKARVVALLHTHAHFDHVGATAAVARATSAAIRLHPADRPLYDALPEQAALFGMTAGPPAPVDQPLEDGEVVAFGGADLRVLHTPGHTPGSCCFLLEGDSPRLFAGDTLFRRSIGRTDLWGGDTDQILASIKAKLYSLPPSTLVICGHGPRTTIGEERASNPFVRA